MGSYLVNNTLHINRDFYDQHVAKYLEAEARISGYGFSSPEENVVEEENVIQNKTFSQRRKEYLNKIIKKR